MNIILQNDLHFRTLQLKLSPNLSKLTGPMKEELNYAIGKEMPHCEGNCYQLFDLSLAKMRLNI